MKNFFLIKRKNVIIIIKAFVTFGNEFLCRIKM
jgi:hypothetical protein